MKVTTVLAAGLVGSASATKFMEIDALGAKGMFKLGVHIAENGYAKPESCTMKNAAVRQEYATLSKARKLDFIRAVKCLNKLPSKTPQSVAPGAKNRYDDFLVHHVQQGDNIHLTGSFFAWRRYYIWSFEQLLRNECGYKGNLPYFNWAHAAEDPGSHPMLDGSATSLSGDGEYIADRPAT